MRLVYAGFFGFMLCAAGAVAETVTYRFNWTGAGGYKMTGALSFDAFSVTNGLIEAEDVICFEIDGHRNGKHVGRWALGMLNEETTWQLNFRPNESAFVVYGEGVNMPQAWNMDGYGYDCGAGGFGFNIGSAAQDICIDGNLIEASQILPPTPFPALRDDSYEYGANACIGPDLLG